MNSWNALSSACGTFDDATRPHVCRPRHAMSGTTRGRHFQNYLFPIAMGILRHGLRFAWCFALDSRAGLPILSGMDDIPHEGLRRGTVYTWCSESASQQHFLMLWDELHMLVICAGNNPSKAKLRGVAKWLRSASQYNLRSVIATLSQRLATHFKAW